MDEKSIKSIKRRGEKSIKAHKHLILLVFIFKPNVARGIENLQLKL